MSLTGHRDHVATECQGSAAYRLLGEMRRPPPSTRRYSMLIYARRGTVDAQAALAAHAAVPRGVVTVSLDEARAALARGEPVVAVGGPAATDLAGTAARVVRGATGADTLRQVAELAGRDWQ